MTLSILSMYDLVTQAAISNGEKYLESFQKRYSKDTITSLSKTVVVHLKEITTAVAPFSYGNRDLFRRHLADFCNAFFTKHLPFFQENKKCQDTLSERRVRQLILGASLETIDKEELTKIETQLISSSMQKQYTTLTEKLSAFAAYVDSLSKDVFNSEKQENRAHYISFFLLDLFFNTIPEELFKLTNESKKDDSAPQEVHSAPATNSTPENVLEEALGFAIRQTTADNTKTIFLIACHQARKNDLIRKITKINSELEKTSIALKLFTDYTQKRFQRWVRRGISNLLLSNLTAKRFTVPISQKRVETIMSAHVTTLCASAGIDETEEKALTQSSAFKKSMVSVQFAFAQFGKSLEKLYHVVPKESKVTHDEKVHFINKLVQGIFHPMQTRASLSPIQTPPETTNTTPPLVQEKITPKQSVRPLFFRFIDAPKTSSYSPVPFFIPRIHT